MGCVSIDGVVMCVLHDTKKNKSIYYCRSLARMRIQHPEDAHTTSRGCAYNTQRMRIQHHPGDAHTYNIQPSGRRISSVHSRRGAAFTRSTPRQKNETTLVFFCKMLYYYLYSSSLKRRCTSKRAALRLNRSNCVFFGESTLV